MEFDFFKYTNKIKPEKGRLLISEPFLNDPNFERTVVLLCEHNNDGSFGFILNKPSESTVSEILDTLATDQILNIGGPVQQDTLHYLHRIDSLSDKISIAKNIYWGGDFEQLQTNLDLGLISQQDIRFFLGYSGWAAGQLEEELKQDSWIVSSLVNEDLLFETPAEEMWRKALSNMGGRFSVYSNYPKDPNLN